MTIGGRFHVWWFPDHSVWGFIDNHPQIKDQHIFHLSLGYLSFVLDKKERG